MLFLAYNANLTQCGFKTKYILFMTKVNLRLMSKNEFIDYTCSNCLFNGDCDDALFSHCVLETAKSYLKVQIHGL